MNRTLTQEQAQNEYLNPKYQYEDMEKEPAAYCDYCETNIDYESNIYWGEIGKEKIAFCCEECYLNEKERLETLQENQDREDIINGK